MTFLPSRHLAALTATALAFASVRGETVKVGFALSAPTNEVAAKADSVFGIVGSVSGLETNVFVVFSPEHLTHRGLFVRLDGDGALPQVGDAVKAMGRMEFAKTRRIFHAQRVEIASSTELPPAPRAKQADFRKGLLYDRRIQLAGRVRYVLAENDGRSTVFRVTLDDHDACVRVSGTIADAARYLDRRVRVTGLAVNRLGRDGGIIEAELHVASPQDIEILRIQEVPSALIYVSAFLGVVALVLIVVLAVLWRRSVRRRLAESVLAAERRRMAADLHDTIEQYLAGAKLIATGVADMKGVEPRVQKAMATLGELLANAKKEVRAVVMDLRSTGDLSLGDTLRGVVEGLNKAGVAARMRLKESKALDAAARGDLVLIVNEAVTNAVKHGHARHIALVVEGNEVAVANDGEPFDPATALGPETGHYGLSGMRERAERNGFELDWTRRGRWNELKVTL